jgi:beta-lactamase superfamily II metal-dependent hydrolase
MIEHRGDFFGVGQGLFICGNINIDSRKLYYMYDCGTESSRRVLKKCIEEAIQELDGSQLDILFLSHLHLDHTSGIDILLNGLRPNNGVRQVVLPYLYPSERVVLMAYASDSGIYQDETDSWYINFLKAPAKYLKDKGALEVYYIRGGDGPGTPPFGELMSHQISENILNEKDSSFKKIPFEIVKEIDKEQTKRIYIAEEEVRGDEPEHLLSARSRIISPYWFFLLFNKDIDEIKLKNLKEEFDDIRNNRNIEDILEDKSSCKEVQLAYERIYGKKRLNETSLAVLSGFRNYNYRKFEFGPHEAPCIPSRCRLPELPTVIYNGKKWALNNNPRCIVFVYTGDLTVNREWPLIRRKFGLENGRTDTYVLAYQVPHHGSEDNWSGEQAEIDGRPTYVISAGQNNKYGHPDYKVIRDIAESNKPLVWAHESCSFPHRLNINC